MPVVHEHSDKEGYYVLAVPFQLSSPVTYQVRNGAAELFQSQGISDKNRVTWSFLQPLIAIGQIYTQQSGVEDTDDLADNLRNLEEKGRKKAVEYIEELFEISGREVKELRSFVEGTVDELSPDLKSELDSRISQSGGRRITLDEGTIDLEDPPLGTDEELKKHLISLFEFSDSQIRTLENLMSGGLFKITPEIASQLGDNLIQEGEMSGEELRRSRVTELLEKVLSEGEGALEIYVRNVRGFFGKTEGFNFQYNRRGEFVLFNLSENQVQTVKMLATQWDAEEYEERHGSLVTVRPTDPPSHHAAEDVLENTVRILREVYDGDLMDVSRAHYVDIHTGSDEIIEPGWGRQERPFP
jgi:hypothetical protein